MPERWREPPLEGMGVIGAWLVHGPGGAQPIDFVVIVAADPATLEPELLQLVEEIVQSTARAWAHWRHRDSLRRVQAHRRAALDAQQAFWQLPDAGGMYAELVRVLVEAVGGGRPMRPCRPRKGRHWGWRPLPRLPRHWRHCAG